MPRISRLEAVAALVVLCVFATVSSRAQAQPDAAPLPDPAATRPATPPAPAQPPKFKLVDPAADAEIEPVNPRFEWEKVPGASGYVLEVGSEKRFDNPLKKPVADGDKPFAWLGKTLLRGRTHVWRVLAIMPDGSKVESETRSFKTRTFIRSLNEQYGLSMRRAFSKKESPNFADPAAFSFLHPASSSSDDIYSIDATLEYSGREKQVLGFRFEPVASIEAHVSNDPKASEDAIRLRGGIQKDFDFGNKESQSADLSEEKLNDVLLQGLYLTVPVKYETNSQYDTQKLTIDPMISPNMPLIGIGELRPLFQPGPANEQERRERTRPENRHGAWLVWRPYAGLEIGKTLDQPDPTKDNPEIFRVMGRVEGRVVFYDISHALSINQFAVFADDTVRYLPGNFDDETGEDFHNFLRAGIDFGVTENFSVLITYKVGEDSPNFNKVESIGIELGIKF
jgi:hypothetical protein